MSGRDLRDLEAVLGPNFSDAIQDFAKARQQALEHPLPRIARQPVLGVKPQFPELAREAKPVVGRAAEKSEHARRKLFEYVQNKDSQQIMKMMDSIEGIRKLKRALSLTPDGKELFDQLARFKLAEVIDKKMRDSATENLKLGTFSNLLKSSKTQDIVKELIGSEAYSQLRLIQKSAGRINASVEKFYNASKSGTTLTDVGLASTAIAGLLTMNPYLALSSLGSIGGLNVAGRLLADETFLRLLKEAILTDNSKKFIGLLDKMRPIVQDAIIESGARSSLIEMGR
jgi:hypothetical protein